MGRNWVRFKIRFRFRPLHSTNEAASEVIGSPRVRWVEGEAGGVCGVSGLGKGWERTGLDSRFQFDLGTNETESTVFGLPRVPPA